MAFKSSLGTAVIKALKSVLSAVLVGVVNLALACFLVNEIVVVILYVRRESAVAAGVLCPYAAVYAVGNLTLCLAKVVGLFLYRLTSVAKTHYFVYLAFIHADIVILVRLTYNADKRTLIVGAFLVNVLGKNSRLGRIYGISVLIGNLAAVILFIVAYRCRNRDGQLFTPCAVNGAELFAVIPGGCIVFKRRPLSVSVSFVPLITEFTCSLGKNGEGNLVVLNVVRLARISLIVAYAYDSALRLGKNKYLGVCIVTAYRADAVLVEGVLSLCGKVCRTVAVAAAHIVIGLVK